MALYLRSQKMDRETGDNLTISINYEDAQREGINMGDIVDFDYGEISLYVNVEITDTEVPKGSVGVFEDIWSKYVIPNDSTVVVSVIQRAESLEYIKKKLLGERLNEHELAVITKDISDRKIREVEIAYFMATFFNPGFSDEEVLYTIKGMANAGDIMNFNNIKNNGNMVVDKHSIGGVAAKGITPILVPIIASHDLVIPNTSTRAITTPAGTTDILEVVMPVALSNDDLMNTVRKTGACMVWGGALKLSPADDVLITVERGLHIQSFQKLMVSIIAKKVSMGVSHIIIDIPYGPGTKVPNPDDIEVLKTGFITLFGKVGIKCDVFTRMVTCPDGYGVGPALEIRDILRIFERHSSRPMLLEETVIKMSGQLLELAGKADKGKGYEVAKDTLESGKALEKFWEIAEAQGAKKRIKSDDIVLGEYSQTIKSEKSGIIEVIDNKEIVKIARSVGNPYIKEAGLYLHKTSGDKVAKGEDLLTIYASSPSRLENGVGATDVEKLVRVRE